MISIPRILLPVGIIAMVTGILGTGLVYRDMKSENILHATTGAFALNTASDSDSGQSAFTLFRTGTLVLFCSFSDTNGEMFDSNRHSGEILVTLRDPYGNFRVQRKVDLNAPRTTSSRFHSWLPIDSLTINDVSPHFWRLSARVTQPAHDYKSLPVTFFVLPPQRYIIGEYLSRGMMVMLGCGILILAGFCMVLFGGSIRNRATDPRGHARDSGR